MEHMPPKETDSMRSVAVGALQQRGFTGKQSKGIADAVGLYTRDIVRVKDLERALRKQDRRLYWVIGGACSTLLATMVALHLQP